MSKVFKRMPLTAAGFPLISALSRQSIVVPGGDMEPSKDRFPMPSAVAMQNVVPSSTGYKSIQRKVQGVYFGGANPTYSIDMVTVPLRDAYDVVRLLFFDTSGNAYLDNRLDNIHSIGNYKTDGTNISYAYIKQETYVFIKQVGCYTYSIGTDSLVPLELNAIEPTAIHGICAASGYLILYDATTIYYSSLTDPTDFYTEYTVDSGAGSIKPLYLKGPIIHCEAIEGGFLIYTTKNVVAALYSGQFTLPFVFKEISNSSGITKHCHVTPNTNNKTHYAWTEAGLLQVSNSASQLVVSEVTEFLQKKLVETFNIGFWGPKFDGTFDEKEDKFYRPCINSWNVSQPTNTDPINVRLAYVGNRYLLISYQPLSAPYYQHALLFDEVLGRWSKLKFNHFAFFDNPTATNPKAYRYEELVDDYNSYSSTKYEDFYKVNNMNQKQDQLIGYLGEGGTHYITTTLSINFSGMHRQEEASSFWNMDFVQEPALDDLINAGELPFVLFGFLDITRDNSIDLTDILFTTTYRYSATTDDTSSPDASSDQRLPVFVCQWPATAGMYELADLYAFNCDDVEQAITLAGASHQYIVGLVGAFDLSGFSFGAKAGGKQSLISRKA